jgi:hypothetical protein
MKYVDCRYAGDAPVEFIKASEGLGRVQRECDMCGSELKPGTWRKSITGKYKDEIGTRYYCATCCDRPSTGEPACLPISGLDGATPSNKVLGGGGQAGVT